MSDALPSRPSVVVIGGGYGGVTTAKELDDVADIVLVEPKDAFVHNVAALRALVAEVKGRDLMVDRFADLLGGDQSGRRPVKPARRPSARPANVVDGWTIDTNPGNQSGRHRRHTGLTGPAGSRVKAGRGPRSVPLSWRCADKTPFPRRQHPVRSGIIETVTSIGLEHLARTAYEAHRGAVAESLPAWKDITDEEQKAWKVAVSAIAGQTGVTLADLAGVPTYSIMVQVGDQRQSFQTDFIAGRQGALAVIDDYASNHHARFTVAHGFWYVKDLGSTNGTSLNGRRIHAPQRLKKGDKIKIGHTVVMVVSA